MNAHCITNPNVVSTPLKSLFSGIPMQTGGTARNGDLDEAKHTLRGLRAARNSHQHNRKKKTTSLPIPNHYAEQRGHRGQRAQSDLQAQLPKTDAESTQDLQFIQEDQKDQDQFSSK